MKTNNRPMIKEIKDIDMGYAGREVIEVERPMTDTEYIEYMENKVNKLKKDYNQECIDHTGTTVMLHKRIDEQQDQFLKVVESVLKEHPISHSEVYIDYIIHKIKSAMEKGKDANQRKD